MSIFVVTNTNDSGAGSLRQAVADANANAAVDTIRFDRALLGQTITLTTGQLSLTNDVRIDGDIDGDDKADITISGNDASRIFEAQVGGTRVILASLTLTNGYAAGSGGAIDARGGVDLVLTDLTVKDSAAFLSGGGLYIGGFTPCSLVAVNVTFMGNHAGFKGGGVFTNSLGSDTFVNATIHGNSADYGGGIYTQSTNLTIASSTITGNSAIVGLTYGGVDGALSIRTTLLDSVVAGNTVPGRDADLGFTATAGNCFFGTDVGFKIVTDLGGNIQGGGDPLLGALQDNGGTVWTRAIQAGSPLIGAGSNAFLPADTLDIDGDGNTSEALPLDAHGGLRLVGGTVDIGAYEYAPNGTPGADRLIFGVGDQSITGGNGDDTIDTGAGNDTIDGGQGDDVIAGGAGADAIDGGDGNDVIVGGAGADAIDGGNDNDLVSFRFSNGILLDLAAPGDSTGDAAGDTYVNVESFEGSNLFGDTMRGSAGNDQFLGLGGDDLLNGRDGNDNLLGGAGADSLLGGNDADVLSGGLGNDTLDGGAGDDVLAGGPGADSFIGGAGRDQVSYRYSEPDFVTGIGLDLATPANNTGEAAGDSFSGIESFVGGVADDTMSGAGTADHFLGIEGNDLLIGLGGNDTLVGGRDNDTIIGGAGRDLMTGGDDEDFFVFESLTDSVRGVNRDVITDFGGGDFLDLTALGLSFVVGGFTGAGNEVRLVDNANGTLVQVDSADPDRAPDFEVFLRGAHGVLVNDGNGGLLI